MSRASYERGDYLDEFVGEFMDFLPHYDIMPNLTREEVERFVALDKQGREAFRAGDHARAEAAFAAQMGIFPPNPEPHVSLALIDASLGSKKEALDHLRAAVVRGFTGVDQIGRTEAWTVMPRSAAFRKLQDAVIDLAAIGDEWPDWGSFTMWKVPESLDHVMREHAALVARIDEMSPALGERLAAMWRRAFARATAHKLQFYLSKRPDAPDFQAALDRVMHLYAGGPLQRWQRLSEAAASRLSEISKVALERSGGAEARPEALVGLALARNADRDKRGALRASALKEIRDALQEVVTSHAESPVLATAVVGLVETEAGAGHLDRAADQYRRFQDEHSGDRRLLTRVRHELGELGLRVGGVPEFQASTLDGETVDMDRLRGKVVVFDFWATWCNPCIDELPVLRRIDEKHGDEVVVLGVNLDLGEELAPEALREWIARERVPGSQVHDGLGWESEIVKAFGVREIPFNVVVDRDGSVFAVNEHGRRLEKSVRAALATRRAEPVAASAGSAR